MAQQVQVILTDDIDGGPAEETVQFELDGKSFEIDLSSENARQLRGVISPYAEMARKAAKTTARGRKQRQRTARAGEDTAAIRTWAKQQGKHVNERGRIPRSIVEEYKRATSAT